MALEKPHLWQAAADETLKKTGYLTFYLTLMSVMGLMDRKLGFFHRKGAKVAKGRKADCKKRELTAED